MFIFQVKTMKDKKLLILIVLGIAAIISLIYGITSQKKTEQPSAKTAKVESDID